MTRLFALFVALAIPVAALSAQDSPHDPGSGTADALAGTDDSTAQASPQRGPADERRPDGASEARRPETSASPDTSPADTAAPDRPAADDPGEETLNSAEGVGDASPADRADAAEEPQQDPAAVDAPPANDRAATLAEAAAPISVGDDEAAAEALAERSETPPAVAAQATAQAERIEGLPARPDAAFLAATVPVEELRLRIRPLRLAEIEPIVENWAGHLRQITAYISQLRLIDRRLAAAQRPRDLEFVRSLITPAMIAKTDLNERATLAADTLELKGGDAAEIKAYIRSVAGPAEESSRRAAEPTPEAQQPRIEGLPTRPDAAFVAGAVPLEDLRLQLQPLRLAEVTPVAESWVGHVRQMTAYISQLRLLERRLGVAVAQVEFGSSERQRIERDQLFVQDLIPAASDAKGDLIDRAGVAVDALRDKGGDADEITAYIRSVGGRVDDVNWRNPREAINAAWTWTVQWFMDPEEGGIDLLQSLLGFAAILALFWFISRFVGKLVTIGLKRSKGASDLLKQFLVGGAERVVLVIGVIVALPMIGIDITPLIAAIGAAGLVIGLALQGTLSNFASGMLILFYRPFDVGDYVDAGGVSGEVKSMTLVRTKIATFDNRVMLVPNNEIWDKVIVNNSGQKVRRVDLEFDVAYHTDIDHAKAVFEEMVKSHPKVLKAPAPNIQVNAYMDSSIRFIVRPWVKTGDYFMTFWELMAEGKKRMDAAGISIPFPQRDLHVPESIRIELAGGRPLPQEASAAFDGASRN